MDKKSGKKEQGKVYCDICRKSIPQWLMPKHQYCQQHLRAKAARMFYQAKSKENPYKKFKDDPDAFFSNKMPMAPEELGPALFNPHDALITKSKTKGIWALIEDETTGTTYFKNKLSGKMQRNRPVGLLDEDFDREVIQSLQENNPQSQFNYQEYEEEDEDEQAKPGEWKEVTGSSWFGEDKEESEEEKFEGIYEKDEIIVEDEESEEEEEGENKREIMLNTVEKLKDKAKESSDEELVEKPVYSQSVKSCKEFAKRNKKSKLQL
ncbi:unnamed protein product [Blepharisma stoltei]|uniref:Uncharacterized protein n=1 Tax=Blepharisma stoltei TaxID=1481888 RepID=A0AAU9JN15_9CILI|nr:unnamed protein product [Blepharisma stoltei]